MSKKLLYHIVFISAVLVSVSFYAINQHEVNSLKDFWQTKNQQGQTALDKGDFAKAAKLFESPMMRGQSLYKDAQFEDAAIAFNQKGTAKAYFNSANALIMMGRYELAIKSYDRAIELNAQFNEAKFNRAIALNRQKVLNDAKDKMDEGTGGMLGADEIVFNDQPANNNQSSDDVTSEEAMNEAEINELWLRRVQTKPADFMKIKFSYQLSREGKASE
ncbi:tetratricopeptide repeat protein [Lentisphaera marina]|uniref:tetratricopeptide repeat protein n=1 Tax=Lentisphaera marina TaxID=1111041 RepID=UPI002365A1E2|nr:tetratricopeptide repeat protein [Lentisphaera marina]MDD7983799.1 tetratricopeptide repeat protein [Lentisphaera marina]